MDHTPPKQNSRQWLAPDCKTQHNPPGLYLVATPIGNLGDITIRALDILELADTIVCEDKRVTSKLLTSYGLKKPLIPYHDHSTEKDRTHIIDLIKSGKIIALVSDAGMPMISDPGYKLIQSCLTENLHITSLPGANAPLTALQLSSLPSENFTFIGFLPNKTSARKNALTHWQDSSATLITFESPKRLTASLKDILTTLGDRQIAVARELTKLHEDIQRGKASTLITHYENDPTPKGEIVLVIAPPETPAKPDQDTIKAELNNALKTMKTKEASKTIAAKYNLNPAKTYDLALTLKK